MKKLLKYLLVPVFVGSTVLTVVACGTNQSVWNQDILNSAVGRMQDHTFAMSDDLNMETLPSDQDKYDDLVLAVRDRISSFYSNLVKPGINWDNPTVAVIIGADKDNSSFLEKYGNRVEARITLVAHLTFRNLSADSNIIVKINNDKTTAQNKIDDISEFLGTYLDNSPTFYSQVLFKDKLMSNDQSVRYLDFEALLRTALFKETTTENPIPIIDVKGIDITVTGPTATTEIYALTGIVDNTTEAATKLIQGKLSNLSLILHNEDNTAQKIITDKTLTVVQNISDVNTQITTMLNQGSEVLQSKISTLPGNITLSQYFETDGKSFKSAIQEKLFAIISKYYPSDKMTGTIDSWSSVRVDFPSASSTPYVSVNNTNGYFLTNISFIVKITDTLTVESLVYNIKLNLIKGS